MAILTERELSVMMQKLLGTWGRGEAERLGRARQDAGATLAVVGVGWARCRCHTGCCLGGAGVADAAPSQMHPESSLPTQPNPLRNPLCSLSIQPTPAVLAVHPTHTRFARCPSNPRPLCSPRHLRGGASGGVDGHQGQHGLGAHVQALQRARSGVCVSQQCWWFGGGDASLTSTSWLPPNLGSDKQQRTS